MSDESNNAQTLISVESLINSYHLKLEELSGQMRQYRDMLDGLLDNDPEYREIAQSVDKQNKLKKIAKEKVLKHPESLSTVDKIKDCQSQIREAKKSLSDYLTQYITLSGARQIERPDGVLMEIIYSAKLIRKKD